jgi:fucose permease
MEIGATRAIAVILLGFSIATIFPMVLGLAGSSYASHSGTVFGILIGLALVGGMTLPWLVGKLAEVWSIRTSLFVVAFDALAIFGFQLVAQRILQDRQSSRGH